MLPPYGNVRFRRAEAQDAEALAACIDAAYAQYASRITALPPLSANCAEGIATCQVWLAEFDGTIVGALILMPEAGFMRLANVAVLPTHAGKGLGRALLSLAKKEAVGQGYREIRLNTHARMPENIRLYTRLGWT